MQEPVAHEVGVDAELARLRAALDGARATASFDPAFLGDTRLRPLKQGMLRALRLVTHRQEAHNEAVVAALTALTAAVEELAARPVVVPERQGPPSNLQYDVETFEVLRRVVRPGDVCVDVGANEGLILAQMLELSPEARHHAFEPIPELAARLREKFPDVEVHEAALATEAGEATFVHVLTNPSYSGLRERRYDAEEELSTITVRTARLDDEIPADVDVRLLKVDVEGGEEGVFRGGQGVLARCRPYVVFEHGLGASDAYGSTPEVIHGLLTDAGLEVSTMARWLAGEPPLDRVRFAQEYYSGREYYFMASPASP